VLSLTPFLALLRHRFVVGANGSWCHYYWCWQHVLRWLMLDLAALLVLVLLFYGTALWSLVLLVLWASLRHF